LAYSCVCVCVCVGVCACAGVHLFPQHTHDKTSTEISKQGDRT